ncbi:1200_t:CDS:2 [Funneliformis geosporum]|nr:1200_t:CDS:2 [Funneliformis geosporum]
MRQSLVLGILNSVRTSTTTKPPFTTIPYDSIEDTYIILAPNGIYDMNHPVMNDDPDNPWNLVDKYQSVSPDGSKIVYSKLPDSKVNQFINYRTSLLAMYLFLTEDPSALNSWTYLENPFYYLCLHA